MENNKKFNKQEHQFIQLFQELTVEQCLELLRKNYKNYSYYVRRALYAIIGAKIYWGDKYVPNYKAPFLKKENDE